MRVVHGYGAGQPAPGGVYFLGLVTRGMGGWWVVRKRDVVFKSFRGTDPRVLNLPQKSPSKTDEDVERCEETDGWRCEDICDDDWRCEDNDGWREPRLLEACEEVTEPPNRERERWGFFTADCSSELFLFSCCLCEGCGGTAVEVRAIACR
eukprot:Hpha_TRINITY_DN16087_c4_g8::TRINITY_DN16087_c4_g8_i1::g.118643::m.118643